MAANKYIPEEDRTDHTGKVFDSIKAMCMAWNRDYSTYISRIKSGISKEEALTKTNRTNIEDRTDHTGQIFNSTKEMCDHWKVKDSKYYSRLNIGWSKEEALTGNRITISSMVDEEDRTDHLGNVYPSKTKMCEAYKVNPCTYDGRILRGATKEEALTGTMTVKNISPVEDRTDHLGNVFDTVDDMCDFWEINKSCYIDRIKRKWSKERALTEKSRKDTIKDSGDCTDHLGNTFESIRDMCDFWEISDSKYHFRISQGYTKEEALTGNYTSKAKMSDLPEEDRTDHLGNVYISVAEMCDHYNCTRSLFYNRRRSGWTIIEALGVIPRLSVKTIGVKILDMLIIKKAYIYDGEIYFFIELNDNQDIKSKNEIIDYYIKNERMVKYGKVDDKR